MFLKDLREHAADQLELVIVSLSSDNLGNALLLFFVRAVHVKERYSSVVGFQMRENFCP